jgi:hypothetical protein
VKTSPDEATKAGYQRTLLFLLNGKPIRWGTPVDQVIAQLYVSFAPADKPEIAVAVVIGQAGHGGSVSPVVRSISAQYWGVKLW